MARRTAEDPLERLTPREREVLVLLRLGLTDGQIAERLAISQSGASYHVSQIIGKLGVRDRYEAAAWPDPPPWWMKALAPFASLWRNAGPLPNALALAAVGSAAVLLIIGAALMTTLLLRTHADADRNARAPTTGSTKPPSFATFPAFARATPERGLPTSTPDAGMPPVLTVNDSDSTLRATLGSYCWQGQSSYTCVDAVAPLTTQESLDAQNERELTITLPGQQLSETIVTASQVSNSRSDLLESGLLAWTQRAQAIDLPAQLAGDSAILDISGLAPDYYVVSLFVRVEGKGDVSCGFLLNKDVPAQP